MKPRLCSLCSLYDGHDKSIKSILAKHENLAKEEAKSCFAVCYAVMVSDSRMRKEDPYTDSDIVYGIHEGGYVFKADSYEEYKKLVDQYVDGETELEFKFWTVFNEEQQSYFNDGSITDEILSIETPVV